MNQENDVSWTVIVGVKIMNYVSVTGNNNILASTDPPYFGLITWITVQTLSTRMAVCWHPDFTHGVNL